MTNAEILQQVAAGKLSPDEATALLVTAAPPQRNLSLKVSEKGAVSVYGLNARFPVTLYAEQWERVLGMGDQIRGFIQQNAGRLTKKGIAA